MDSKYDVTITWSLCKNYDEACEFARVLYLHTHGDTPILWGKAASSWLAGKTREYQGLRLTAYYLERDRHWIDRCLAQGDHLYVGEVDREALKRNPSIVGDSVAWLIALYPTPYNRERLNVTPIRFRHMGYVPACLMKTDQEED